MGTLAILLIGFVLGLVTEFAALLLAGRWLRQRPTTARTALGPDDPEPIHEHVSAVLRGPYGTRRVN